MKMWTWTIKIIDLYNNAIITWKDCDIKFRDHILDSILNSGQLSPGYAVYITSKFTYESD